MSYKQKDYNFTEVENSDIIQEEFLEPSTLETIDFAMTDWLKENVNVHSNTTDGWKKVPVIWTSAERSFQIKHSQELRDEDGSLILPIVSLERTSMSKDLNSKGVYYGNPGTHNDSNYGGRVTIARRIVQDKTANFANADSSKGLVGVRNTPKGQINFPRKNKKVVYETISIPMPVYVTNMYTITLRSEYQQQMNDMVTPFISLGGHINSFSIKREGHSYEAFVQSDFAQMNNVSNMAEDERQYQTRISIRVLGYLMGEGPNQERPKIIKTQNAVQVRMPREHVIVGDIPEHIDKRGFYRE